MRRPVVPLYGFVIYLAALCAGGCQGSAMPAVQTSEEASLHGLPLSPFSLRSAAPMATAFRSWMSADATLSDLLYVADGQANTVYVYSYPGGKLKGALTGFDFPAGLCADKVGDVFVTQFGDPAIVEFAHGGSTPIATLNNGGKGFASDCAVDPTTGNLAVANQANPFPNVAGNIALFTHAQGAPKLYRAMWAPYSCGYDPNGNLFVDGEGPDFRVFKFGEIAKGSNKFSRIVLAPEFVRAGGVQWDGTHLAVGDAEGKMIYQFAIQGTTATQVGSTRLPRAQVSWQFWIDGATVIVPDNLEIRPRRSSVLFYNYPQGGVTKRIGGKIEDPIGVVVSDARSQGVNIHR